MSVRTESQVSSRSVAEPNDQAAPGDDYITDVNTDIDEALETGLMFKLARILAVISVVVGMFKLAYPDHLRL